MNTDKLRIDKLVEDFFNAFTNKGETPNLQFLYEACIDETVIVKNTNGICEKYNLENFIAPRKELLTNGTLTGFVEYEVEEQTVISSNIAQRVSHYLKEGALNNQRFSSKGTKMFQFVKMGSIWKICCIVWDDE